MSKFKSLLASLLLLGFTDCFQPPRSAEQEKRDIVEGIRKETIALVEWENGEADITCSGVWVAQNLILTAHHCVRDGLFFNYQVLGDINEVRAAIIVDGDEIIDLALLMTEPTTTPQHPIAKLATSVWVGEHVNIEGHTVGLGWSYSEGVIANVRKNMKVGRKFFPKLLQISSPAWFGNSGGGAFNDRGELVGICSWVNGQGPMLSFFIHRDSIKKFLANN